MVPKAPTDPRWQFTKPTLKQINEAAQIAGVEDDEGPGSEPAERPPVAASVKDSGAPAAATTPAVVETTSSSAETESRPAATTATTATTTPATSTNEEHSTK